jgi:cytochrome c556
VDTRRALFKLVNWSFAPTGEMLRNKAKWDAATVQKGAARLEALAPMIPDAFALDTRNASGLSTKARDGIWTSQADFQAKAEDFRKAAANLAAVAARSGVDEKALRQAAMEVGKTCSGCHDSYKDK